MMALQHVKQRHLKHRDGGLKVITYPTHSPNLPFGKVGRLGVCVHANQGVEKVKQVWFHGHQGGRL